MKDYADLKMIDPTLAPFNREFFQHLALRTIMFSGGVAARLLQTNKRLILASQNPVVAAIRQASAGG